MAREKPNENRRIDWGARAIDRVGPWPLWICWIVGGNERPLGGTERQREPKSMRKTRGARGRVRNERVPLAPQAKTGKQLGRRGQNQPPGRAGPFPDCFR